MQTAACCIKTKRDERRECGVELLRLHPRRNSGGLRETHDKNYLLNWHRFREGASSDRDTPRRVVWLSMYTV